MIAHLLTVIPSFDDMTVSFSDNDKKLIKIQLRQKSCNLLTKSMMPNFNNKLTHFIDNTQFFTEKHIGIHNSPLKNIRNEQS